MLVLALMPAIGDGTRRDLLLDLPVFWIADTNYLLLSAAAVVVAYAGRRFILYSEQSRKNRLFFLYSPLNLSVPLGGVVAKNGTPSGSRSPPQSHHTQPTHRQQRPGVLSHHVWFCHRCGDDGYDSRACLLYTSPSPRDLSTSRMPSSA